MKRFSLSSRARTALASMAAFAAIAAAPVAQASVVVAGTRVIYPSNSRDVSVRVTNNGEVPALVQAWLDNGDASVKPEELDVPFSITPSIYRLDPTKTQIMRLVFLGAQLPADRESVYWLNVLEVPPKPSAGTGENYLQFAIKTRIKVFYRPVGLPGSPEAAMHTLKWSVTSVNEGVVTLRVDNPSPFHVSFAEVRLQTATGLMAEALNGMVVPQGSLQLTFKPAAGAGAGAAAAQPVRVQFKAVNDYGAFVDGTSELR